MHWRSGSMPHRPMSSSRPVPRPLASVANDVVRARNAAERAGVKAQLQTVEAVRALTDLGLSRRDAENSSACHTNEFTNCWN